MWVQSQMGITGNDRADKAAKDALDQNVVTTIKVVKSDYCNWVKEKSSQGWQNERRSSANSMVTIKPHVDRYKNTEGLPQRQQMAVSRLRMSYTNITHGYKIRDEIKPQCEKCDQEVTVEHLIWQCAAYNSQRRRNSINKDSMSDNNEETGRLTKYLKETGLLYSI
jgi:hypothetical protein